MAQTGSPRQSGTLAFGRTMFVLFSAVQVADGWLTYEGLRLYGLGIEANPLIVSYAAIYGAGVALVGAKAMAVSCGAVLYVTARHATVGLLTIGYLAAAIWPWTRILWP